MSKLTTPLATESAFTRTSDRAKKGIMRQRRVGRTPASNGEPREPRLMRIARRAHELYEARGGQDGRDLDDWLKAEREIDAEIDGEARDR